MLAASDLLALATSRLVLVAHATAAASRLHLRLSLVLLGGSRLAVLGLRGSSRSSGRLGALLLLLLDVLSGFLDGLLDLGLLLFVVVRLLGLFVGSRRRLLGRQALHALRSLVTDSRALGDAVVRREIPLGQLAEVTIAAARVVGIAHLGLDGTLLDGDLLEAEVELDSAATLGLQLVSIGGLSGLA